MMGFHALAAQNGERPVSELHGLLTPRTAFHGANVVAFPVSRARPAARRVPFGGRSGVDASRDNVIVFPASAARTRRRDDQI